jgi:hypothetical protein
MSNLPVSTTLRMHGSSSPLQESTETRLPVRRLVCSSVPLCGQESRFHCVATPLSTGRIFDYEVSRAFSL